MTDSRIAIVRPYTDQAQLNDPECRARAAQLLSRLDAYAAAPHSADDVERVAKAIRDAVHRLPFTPLGHAVVDADCEDITRAALSALPPRDDLAATPCKLCPHVLACSRCGEPVGSDYESGLCRDGDDSPENGGTLDVHDQAEPYHDVNGPCSPPHSSKPVAQVSRLVGGPNDSGWYYHDEGCPDEGAVGPFETRDEAEAHAHCGGYRIEEQSDDLAERFVEAVRKEAHRYGQSRDSYERIVKELDRLDAERKAKL